MNPSLSDLLRKARSLLAPPPARRDPWRCTPATKLTTILVMVIKATFVTASSTHAAGIAVTRTTAPFDRASVATRNHATAMLARITAPARPAAPRLQPASSASALATAGRARTRSR